MFSLTVRVSSAHRDDLIAAFWEAGTVGITEGDDTLCAFFDAPSNASALLHRFAAHHPNLKQEEDRHWLREYQEQWTPFPVGDRFYLVPEFREDPAPCGRIRLRTRPGMACGTGTHPATQLCLRALERYVSENDSVLDVGTGSGILAEAAKLLGADTVVACDIDHVAAVIARTNLANSPSPPLVFTGSLRSIQTGIFDVVVANLNATTLITLRAEAVRVLRRGGKLILSGFGQADGERVTKAFENKILETLEMDGWICQVL